ESPPFPARFPPLTYFSAFGSLQQSPLSTALSSVSDWNRSARRCRLIHTRVLRNLPLALLLALVLNRPGQSAGPLQIVIDSLLNGAPGVFYSQQLAISGGSCSTAGGTATSTIDSGALPGGLSVVSPPNSQSWTIQGVPAAGGSFQ